MASFATVAFVNWESTNMTFVQWDIKQFISTIHQMTTRARAHFTLLYWGRYNCSSQHWEYYHFIFPEVHQRMSILYNLRKVCLQSSTSVSITTPTIFHQCFYNNTIVSTGTPRIHNCLSQTIGITDIHLSMIIQY